MQPQQQQQQTVVASPVVGRPIVQSYRDGQSKIIGILLIVTGALTIILCIAGVIIWRHVSTADLWLCGSGTMFVIAGGFGIGAARKKTRCMINTFLVLTIIGAVLAAIQLVFCSIGASAVIRVYSHAYYRHSGWEAVYAMSILLALLAVAAFVFCLWGSILCCATGGCCAPTQPTVYVAPAGQQVMVTVPQQQQPMQPMQPPAYQQPVVYYPPQNPGYAPPSAQYGPASTPGYEQK